MKQSSIFNRTVCHSTANYFQIILHLILLYQSPISSKTIYILISLLLKSKKAHIKSQHNCWQPRSHYLSRFQSQWFNDDKNKIKNIKLIKITKSLTSSPKIFLIHYIQIGEKFSPSNFFACLFSHDRDLLPLRVSKRLTQEKVEKALAWELEMPTLVLRLTFCGLCCKSHHLSFRICVTLGLDTLYVFQSHLQLCN